MSLCRDCGREWTAAGECHCCGCCEHFGSVTSFDAHQDADGCHDPRTLSRKDGTPRMFAVRTPQGVTWVTGRKHLPVTFIKQTIHGVECYEAWRDDRPCPHEDRAA